MNLLASLLPGVRELRTPLAVGAMWFATAWLYLAPHWDRVRTTNDGIAGFVAAFERLPDVYTIGALSLAVYVTGCAAAGLGSSLRGRVERRWNHALTWLGNRAPIRRRWRLHTALRRTRDVKMRAQGPTRWVLSNVVAEHLARTGMPPVPPDVYPLHAVTAQLDVAAYQLWKEAPAQYEEYDRLRAEAEFRSGMVLPLIALGLLAAVRASWIALPVAVAVAAAMAWQGFMLGHRSQEVLASAAYNDLVRIPLLDGLVQELKPMDFTGLTDEECLAEALKALWRRNARDAAEEMLNSAFDVYDVSSLRSCVCPVAPELWEMVTMESLYAEDDPSREESIADAGDPGAE